jgi:hypothetical protein
MDVEVALPLGNIGDKPEACGNTREGFTCAAPEYAAGPKGGGGGGGRDEGMEEGGVGELMFGP